MKAIVSKMKPDGRYPDIAMNGRWVTGTYASRGTLMRHAVRTLPAGRYRVEIYRDDRHWYSDEPPETQYVDVGEAS